MTTGGAEAPPATALGIDVGGTKILGVRLEDGEVRSEFKVKTPVQGGPLGVVDAIAKVVTELGGPSRRTPVGVGAPGVVDVARGVVRTAPNLPGWIEPFALGPALAEAIGQPVVVDNDVNVATVAEHRLGAGRAADELLAVFVGTGVGGGLVFDGRLRRGAAGTAGEIGHTVSVPNGRLCGCGGRGHLEAYAGRAGMERRARELEAEGNDTLLCELAGARRMTSSVWAKALAASDAVAVELVDEAVGALGRAIAAVVTVLDLELVVIGGGLADRLGPTFVGRIEQAVRTELMGGATALKVVAAALGDRAGAVGAALVAVGAGEPPP